LFVSLSAALAGSEIMVESSASKGRRTPGRTGTAV